MTDERHLIGRRPVHQGNYKWAIYRMHYGLDFLSQSISSIRDDVDKIFICYSLQPWVVRDKVSYLGDEIDMPNNPENIEEYLKIYKTIWMRTLQVSLMVTIFCLILAYPVSYLLASGLSPGYSFLTCCFCLFKPPE